MRTRSYEEGDRDRILDLLNAESAWPTPEIGASPREYWEWKFLRAPSGAAMIGVVEEEEKILSHSAAIPFQMRIGAGRYLASQGLDAFTHPDHRKRGLIELATGQRDEERRRRGVEFDIAFTSDEHHAGFARRRGYRELRMKMVRYESIVDPDAFFRRGRLRAVKRLGYLLRGLLRSGSMGRMRKASSRFSVTDIQEFDSSFDEMFDAAKDEFDLVFWKDSRYLNWRYADRAAGEFVRMVARKGEGLAGFIILRVAGGEGGEYAEIADILVRPGTEGALETLMVGSLDYLRKRGASTVACWLPLGHPYATILKKAGFSSPENRIPRREMIVMYVNRSGRKEINDILSKEDLRVHLMLGDSDWI